MSKNPKQENDIVARARQKRLEERKLDYLSLIHISEPTRH